MFDLTPILEFSRQQCVGICAFLVPINLIATSLTLVLVFLKRPIKKIRWVATMAMIFASGLFLHVATWLMIGVIMIPTFVLTGLGATCLIINAWAISNKPILRFS